MLHTLVSTENMSREDWLQWRCKGIGGSDASIICGVNKYQSPVELWMVKTGQIEPQIAGEPAYWGSTLEPLVRAEFTKRTGIAVNEVKAILQHPEHPFMFANLDGITQDNFIFEAKTASTYNAHLWEDDNIPEEYILQIQHYMSVTGFTGCYIAVLIGGNTFQWKFIPRDEELIEMLIELEQQFWWHIESNTPPEFDGSDASTALINRLYDTTITGSGIILPDDTLSLVDAYIQADAEAKEATERKEEASNKLKALMQNTEVATIGERTISWKPVTVERLNSALLKTEHPKLYHKYLTKSSYRRFAIR